MGRLRQVGTPLLVAAAAAVATMVVRGDSTLEAGRLAGIAGAGVTGIQVINLDPTSLASVTAEFHSQAIRPPVHINRPGVSATTGANFYLPAEFTLANGAYAASVTSDRPVGVLANTAWLASGGLVLHGAVEPSTDVLVPFVAKAYVGQTSIVNIQNTDPSASSSVTLDVFAAGQTSPSASATVAVRPGASVSIDLEQFPNFAQLPSSFAGWARVTSATPVAVQSFVDIATSALAVFAVDGVPASAATNIAYAPLVCNACEPGGFVSGISVLNPASTAIEAVVTYNGIAGACAGDTFVHGPAAIPGGGTQVFYQGDVAVPGSGASGLPEDCAATAKVAATGPMVAVANMTRFEPHTSAAYIAQPEVAASRRLVLPLWRQDFHGSTIVHVANPGGTPAQATLRLFDANGNPITACGADCAATVPAGGGARWALHTMTGVPNGLYGVAEITSDLPLVATVLDHDGLNPASARNDAVYNGVAGDMTVNDVPEPRHIPLVLRDNSSGNPVPTRAPPTATVPGASPVPTSTGGTPSPTPRPVATQPGTSIMDTAGITGIQVMNHGDTETAIVGTFRGYTGGDPVAILRPSVQPHAAANLYLPVETSLRNGLHAFYGTATGQPTNLIGRTDWLASGQAVISNAPAPATDILVPAAMKGVAGQNWIIAIQNVHRAQAATATLELFPDGETGPAASLELALAAGGATAVLVDRHPALDGALPDGFVGWARVRSDTLLAVQVIVEPLLGDAYRGAYSFEGVPAQDLASNWFAPMAFRRRTLNRDDPDAGALRTGITLLNPGTATVDVTVRYTGAIRAGNPCAGETFVHGDGAFALAAGATVAFVTDLAGLSGESHLPEGCEASAVVEATGPVAGFSTIDTAGAAGAGEQIGGYNLVAADGGGTRVELTLARREHTNRMLTTPIQVQNVSAEAADVTLTVLRSDGTTIACGAPCDTTLAPGASRLWWPSDVPGWEAGTYGAAVVESDQPVAAVVADLSLTGAMDMAAYVGMVDHGWQAANLPLAMLSARLADAPVGGPPPATPTPFATPNPDATPIPTLASPAGFATLHIPFASTQR